MCGALVLSQRLQENVPVVWSLTVEVSGCVSDTHFITHSHDSQQTLNPPQHKLPSSDRSCFDRVEKESEFIDTVMSSTAQHVNHVTSGLTLIFLMDLQSVCPVLCVIPVMD
ncbi:uncharacterized protein LOC113081148 isoform X3 [Carassius auratus]|uniref:Uncharacterized protein LOC113081148 isoform X3 n=1 Tax=Carassius auratus TaxID=7957 RepID=A0A6P6NJ32_CARAU|nr:uncharacterized protein LOC113081148 isoform X3 [Carassius auratus]